MYLSMIRLWAVCLGAWTVVASPEDYPGTIYDAACPDYKKYSTFMQ
jgi:hypothetical protein